MRPRWLILLEVPGLLCLAKRPLRTIKYHRKRGRKHRGCESTSKPLELRGQVVSFITADSSENVSVLSMTNQDYQPVLCSGCWSQEAIEDLGPGDDQGCRSLGSDPGAHA